MEIELVKPQGYCAGVQNAINIAFKARKENPNKNVYVFGMLVHNSLVMKELEEKNIITLNIPADKNRIPTFVKPGDVLIFTAHGHSEKVEQNAKKRGLIIYDATCPNVKRNLELIKKETSNSHQVIYIGLSDHRESLAALSVSKRVHLFDIDNNIVENLKITDKSPIIISQTTLDYNLLKQCKEKILQKYPNARVANEVCSTTRLRQEALLNLPKDTDLIIVVGEKYSSNARRLYLIAQKNFPNAQVYITKTLNEIKSMLSNKYKKAAITSSASTPIIEVNKIVDYLKNNFR